MHVAATTPRTQKSPSSLPPLMDLIGEDVMLRVDQLYRCSTVLVIYQLLVCK